MHYLHNNVLVIDQSEYIDDRPVPGPFPAFPMTKREKPWERGCYEQLTFEDNISEHGQLNRSGLRQSQGKHSLPETSPCNFPTLELVHSERPVYTEDITRRREDMTFIFEW